MVVKRRKKLTKKQIRYFGTARQRAALHLRRPARLPTRLSARKVTKRRRKKPTSLASKLLNFIKSNWGAAVAGALVGYSAKSLQDWLMTRGQSPAAIAKVAASPAVSTPIESRAVSGTGSVASRVLNAGEQVALNAWQGIVGLVNPQAQPNAIAPTLTRDLYETQLPTIGDYRSVDFSLSPSLGAGAPMDTSGYQDFGMPLDF